MPKPSAFFAALSEATCAAKGVDFFYPLNPAAPAEDQQSALPLGSVIVTTVLLKVAVTKTTPRLTCFLVFFFAIISSLYSLSVIPAKAGI